MKRFFLGVLVAICVTNGVQIYTQIHWENLLQESRLAERMHKENPWKPDTGFDKFVEVLSRPLFCLFIELRRAVCELENNGDAE